MYTRKSGSGGTVKAKNGAVEVVTNKAAYDMAEDAKKNISAALLKRAEEPANFDFIVQYLAALVASEAVLAKAINEAGKNVELVGQLKKIFDEVLYSAKFRDFKQEQYAHDNRVTNIDIRTKVSEVKITQPKKYQSKGVVSVSTPLCSITFSGDEADVDKKLEFPQSDLTNVVSIASHKAKFNAKMHALTPPVLKPN